MKKFLSFCILSLFVFCSELQAQSINGSKANEELMHPPPVVNFYITGLCYGDTTNFISKTDIGDIYWAITNDKGDTLFSIKSVNTKYYFKKKGIYNIFQTADNGHIASKLRTVVVDTITHADFYFRPCINEFNNLSTCSNQYVWVFPDGTSTDTFPKYQFAHKGGFPITLTAKKGNKSNTVTKTISVPPDSLGVPAATFTFKRQGNSNTFEFTAVDTIAVSYSWNFGDRVFDDASGYKVTHTIDTTIYEAPVVLRVANGCGFSIYQIDPYAITGIPAYSLDKNSSIYPNPASDELNMLITNLPHVKTIVTKLINIEGAVIQENKAVAAQGTYTLKWNTASLAKGIYLVQIIVDDQLVNKKVVVQ